MYRDTSRIRDREIQPSNQSVLSLNIADIGGSVGADKSICYTGLAQEACLEVIPSSPNRVGTRYIVKTFLFGLFKLNIFIWVA